MPVHRGGGTDHVPISAGTHHRDHVLALFLAYNVLESNVILPNVYGRAMGISSLAVLVAAPVGYALLGLVGVLIALPLTAAIKPAESAWGKEIC